MSIKVCTVCELEKPFEEFYNRQASEDGKAYRCKECDNQAVKKYRKAHEERYRIKARTNQLRFKYGIEPEEYERLNKNQDGLCAICQQPNIHKPPHITKLVVDHCHATGKVRGLLCNKCNQALGLFQENVENLARATSYLSEIH